MTPVTSPATFKGAANCPSGVYDPRNGGECWACDPGFGRTGSAVTAWDACGRIGAKARSASYVARICPTEGAFLDKRNGGECWVCPPGYDRTTNPVTGARACKKELDLIKATERGDFLCKPGEVHDSIDGGTCWTCPQGYKRTWDSVKSATACVNNQMQWEMPNRQLYGLFNLGWGANDILAQLIAERTKIDAAITEIATDSNENEALLRKEAWDVINSEPWKSPILAAVLQEVAINAAAKNPSERTLAERDFVERLEKLIQWNRQFVAYQAKQAHDNWVRASEAYYAEALKKMGAAAVYSDSMVTPPDYNEMLVGAIQVGAGVGGPIGAALALRGIPAIKKVVFPYIREAVRKGAVEVAKKAGGSTIKVLTGSSASTMTAAAAGPLIIAAAAAVIVTMEIDKFVALEKAEAQIADAIRKADRPVVLKTLLQMTGGMDELLYHWSAIVNAPTDPRVNPQVMPSKDYEARLNAYKAGKAELAGKPTMVASVQLSEGAKSMLSDLSADELNARAQATIDAYSSINLPGMGTPTPSTAPGTGSVGQVSPWTQGDGGSNGGKTFANLVQQTVMAQPRTAPAGAMRIEVSNRPGLCVTKKTGADNALRAQTCNSRQSLWIAPDMAQNLLIAAEKYCLITKDGKRGDDVVVGRCPKEEKKPGKDAGTKWQLTQDGQIQQVDTDQCMTLTSSMDIVLQPCGSQRAMQIWRPMVPAQATSSNANGTKKPRQNRP